MNLIQLHSRMEFLFLYSFFFPLHLAIVWWFPIFYFMIFYDPSCISCRMRSHNVVQPPEFSTAARLHRSRLLRRLSPHGEGRIPSCAETFWQLQKLQVSNVIKNIQFVNMGKHDVSMCIYTCYVASHHITHSILRSVTLGFIPFRYIARGTCTTRIHLE